LNIDLEKWKTKADLVGNVGRAEWTVTMQTTKSTRFFSVAFPFI